MKNTPIISLLEVAETLKIDVARIVLSSLWLSRKVMVKVKKNT
jgi:hypothetical protein